jgi:UDP-N-acetylglucosamine 2-epimerase (non-hydrolysing)
LLSGEPNIRLVEPYSHRAMIAAMRDADLILSDSGGVQEEAPGLGVPLLVLREKTERPEGVEAGLAELVGTDEEKIVARASAFLSAGGGPSGQRMENRFNPYGDGLASERIAAILTGRPFTPFAPPA